MYGMRSTIGSDEAMGDNYPSYNDSALWIAVQ